MNKNCLYFNLHIDNQHNIYYYAMMYNTLRTMFYYYDGSFDIVIFQSFIDGLSFFDYSYLDKYNLAKDFAGVRILTSDYKEKHKNQEYTNGIHSPWMSKWYNLYNVYNMGYEKVFMVDCDLTFFSNPSYIFSKYNSDHVWVLGCADQIFSCIYPNKHPIMSGQVLIDFSKIKLPENFYERCIETRIEQSLMADSLVDKYDQNSIRSFKFFSEQYSAQIVLENLGAKYDYFEPIDFTTAANSNLVNKTGNHMYEINCINQEIVIENVKSSIIHYSAGEAAFNLPKYLRDIHLQECHDKWFQKINRGEYEFR